MENTSKQYDAVISKCISVFENKMLDYGSAWRILSSPSLTDQIFIKTQRIRNIKKNVIRKIDEGEETEFIGIINYSVMSLIQIEKGIADKPDLDTKEALKLYKKQIDVTKNLMNKKNHDYDEAWREMRLSSFSDLILQKLLRIKQIEDKGGKPLVSEGLPTNYQDIINYAVFAMILLGEA